MRNLEFHDEDCGTRTCNEAQTADFSKRQSDVVLTNGDGKHSSSQHLANPALAHPASQFPSTAQPNPVAHVPQSRVVAGWSVLLKSTPCVVLLLEEMLLCMFSRVA